MTLIKKKRSLQPKNNNKHKPIRKALLNFYVVFYSVCNILKKLENISCFVMFDKIEILFQVREYKYKLHIFHLKMLNRGS